LERPWRPGDLDRQCGRRPARPDRRAPADVWRRLLVRW